MKILKQENRNIFLVVGLGNPWEKYKNTRHNIGSWVLDYFAKENNFSDFIFSKKFNSLISQNEFKGKKIVLAKPQTFMNDSGQAIKKLFTNCQLPTANLIIIHDDIDVGLGKIKIVKDCGSAGHKGIESAINELKTKNFIRIRIGVKPESDNIATIDNKTTNNETSNNKMPQRPKKIDPLNFPQINFRENKSLQKNRGVFWEGGGMGGGRDLKKFVLEKFNKKEKEIMEKIAKKIKQAIEMILEQGLSQAMNMFNKKN